MRYRTLKAFSYGFGVWVVGVAIANIELPSLAPTAADIESATPMIPVRPLKAKKNASNTLLAGRRALQAAEPVRPTPNIASLDLASIWKDTPPLPAPVVRLPRLRLPSAPAPSDAAVRRGPTARFEREIPPAPALATPRVQVRLPESAVEYLLMDESLSDPQWTIVRWILDRYRARKQELHARIQRDLAWVKKIAPDGVMTGETASRALAVLNTHIVLRQRMEENALNELRRALTDAQWKRFQGWIEARPWVPLGEDDVKRLEALPR
jgi:hypothetical protein